MTLGESLNNPLDIKHDGKTVWVGQSPVQSDPTFVSFISPEYCYRAGAKILASYQKRGIVTLQGAVYRWAPPADRNDTEAYVKHMCDFTGWSRGTPFMRDLLLMLKGLTMFEQGKVSHPDSIIAAGIRLAQETHVNDPVPQHTTMATVMAHPATQKVITGSAAAAFVGMELAKFHVYDMSGGETVALGIVFSILFHRLFPAGLSVQ